MSLLFTASCADSKTRYASSKPEDVAPKSDVAPCSQRLEPIPLADLSGIPHVSEALAERWGAHNLTAVEENATFLPDEGEESPGLRIRYPKGSTAFSAAKGGRRPLGGASFYVPVQEMSGGEALCLRYQIRFPQAFDFAKGGKLPGLYGGEAPSGGEAVTGENGWSVRLMWRKDGEGELYEYVANKKGKFGLSVGRGTFVLPRGEWITIDLEIVPNDVGNANGIARLWVYGRPTIEQQDIIYRTSSSSYPAGLMFSTFFGGSSSSWASPKDQHADFANFRLFGG